MTEPTSRASRSQIFFGQVLAGAMAGYIWSMSIKRRWAAILIFCGEPTRSGR